MLGFLPFSISYWKTGRTEESLHSRAMEDRRRPLGVALAFVVVMAGVYGWATGGDTVPAPVEVPAPEPAAAAAVPTPAPRKAPRKPPPRTYTPPPQFPDDRDDEPAADAKDVQVSGRVLDERGQPVRKVRVLYKSKDKGRRSTKSDEFGRFSFQTSGYDIDVWAERKDGALTARSERVRIDGSGEWEVDLVLETTKRAGLGVKVRGHADGIAIRSVLPGTPAAELGLVKGDVIVEVDGENIAGQTVSTVTGKLTGPVGTSQRFIVRHSDGSEEEYEFERKSIDRERRRSNDD